MLTITRKHLAFPVLFFLLSALLPAGPGFAGSVWTGAKSEYWSDALNWKDGMMPANGGVLTFDPNSTANLNNNNDMAGLTNLSFDMQKSGVTISGNAIGLGSAGISVSLLGSSTFNVDLNQPGDTTYTVGSSRTITLNGVVSGAGGIVKAHGGELFLNGANTYTGGVQLNAGTVVVGSDGNLGDAAGGLTFNGGTLQTTADITTSRAVAVGAGGGTIDTDGNNLYAWGTTTGSGSLTVKGGGMLSLASNASAFDGNLIVNNSTLRIMSNDAMGTTTGNLTLNGGTLRIGNPFTTNEAIVLGTGGGTINTFDTLTATLAGDISGAEALTTTGGGTLILTGANTYSGTTTVTDGTLQGHTGSLKGNITNNAAVVFDQAADGTYAGDMIGTGSFTKTGGGTLILSGSNSYTGGTTVNAGKLQGTTTSLQGDIVNSSTVIFAGTGAGTYTGIISGTGDVIHNSGATTFTGAHTYSGGTRVNGGYLSGTTASLQGNFVVNGNLTFDQAFDGTFSGDISGTASAVPFTGGLTKQGSGTVTLTGTNTYNGGTRVLAGTLQGNTASLQGAIDTSWGTAVVFDQGADGTYAGDMSGWGSLKKLGAGILTLSGTNTYTGVTFVTAGTLQGNTTSLRSNITNNAAVIFDQSADGTYTGNMMGTGSLTKTGNGTLTLSGANTYTGGTIVNAGKLAGTTTSLWGNIVNNTGVIFDQAGNGTYAGVMSGTGSLTKTGTGRVTLSGANTYSGGTSITGGTLAVGADNNLGAASGGLTLNGGTLQFDGSFTSSRSVTLQAGGGTFNTNGNDNTLSGILSGAGGLTKTGAGTLTLTGANSYSGGTAVSAGTLQGTATSLRGNIANNAAVAFDQAANGTYAGIMSGTGSLTKSGSGTLTLSGANTYSGGTAVTGGTLQGTTTSLQGNIANNAAVVFNQGVAGTYAGAMSGTGSLTKSGAGTLTLSGVNTYSGGTTVSKGRLAGTTASLQGAIANDAAVEFNQNTNGTYAGVMGGTGSLTKAGTGTVTLTATNTYSGGTLVSAGTLQGTTNSLQRDIANNAAVVFDQSTSGTYTGAMSGTGSLTKSGAGTVTLTGNNSYSGGTAVNGGTLAVGADNNLGSAAGGLAFNGGTLRFDGSFTSSRNAVLNAGGGNFDTNGHDNTLAGILSGTGGLAKSGAGTLTLSGANTYNGGVTVGAGTLQGTTASLRGDIFNNAAVVFDQATGGTYAGVMSGTGSLTKEGAGTLTLSGANTYNGGTTVNEGALRGTTASLQGNIANNAAVVFDQGSNGTYAGIMSGIGGLTKEGAGTLTLSGANTYTGGTTVNAGTLQGTTASLQGNIANNAAVVFDQGGSGTYAGVMGGTGSLTKSGTGTVFLTGNNSYSGGTAVNGGILAVGADNNLGAAAGGLAFNGGTFRFDGSFTSSRNAVLNAGGGIVDTNGNDNTLAGTLSGTGGLTKTGGGTLTLSGANTYSGGTTVSAGTLQGTTGSLRGDILNNAAVVFDQGSSGTYAGVMSGTGSLTKNGVGTLTLSGTNIYSGGTTVNAGTLQGTTASLQGNIANKAAVVFDQGANGNYTGTMSGTGSLTKNGVGTLTLSGTNTYSGGTTVGAGTLQGNTASLQGNIANNSIVVFEQGTDGAYAGVMIGTGSLTKSGAGKLTLSGANTYSGGTTVSSGAIQGNTASLQGNIINNASVFFNQNTDGTYGGAMSGSGILAKTGTGTVTLSGPNTYTGGTQIFSGALQGNTGSLQGNIVNQAAVIFDQGANGTYAGVMSGTGSLSKTGAGTLTLTGANTYSGGATVSAGTLQGNSASLQGGITNNAAVVFNQAAAGTYAGVMSGTGSLTKSGTGILSLTGLNSYSGGTIISAGALQGNAASLQGNIANAGALIFDQGAAGTYAGVISGTGGFTKTGAGTLSMTGVNTYSGSTAVNAGILAVNGSLAGPVTVGAAGTLGGGGTVGNVEVSGHLAPGNSIGTLNTGSLTFNAGSVYAVEVDAAGNSDRTNVTGTVSLGSATLNVLAQNGTYGVQTDYLIIANDGVDAVSGTFGAITSNLAFLDPTVAYTGGDGNDVTLSMARNDVTFSAVATTPNESAVAGALEQMAAGPGGDAPIVLTALTGLSAPQACRAYNEMSGAGNAAFFDTGIAGMTQYMKTMTQRMGALRAGGGGGSPAFSAGSVYHAAADTGTVSDADPSLFALGNASPLTPDKNWGIWGRSSGMWGSRSGDDIASRYNYSMGGFTLGMDSRISDEFIAGFSAGYAHTVLDFDQLADTGKSDSYQAAFYADYTAGPWYADAILSYAANGYETTRTITVGGLTRTAVGDFDGREAAAYIEWGYVILRDGFFFRPMASLQLTHVVLDGYTETGAGALNLSVGKRSVDSYLGSAGVRVSRPLAKSDDLLLSPEVRLRWAHEFSGDDRAVNAGFAGVPGARFKVTGDEPIKDSAILGLGLNTLFRENFNFYLNYDVNVSRKHTDHGLVGGLRYMWD